MNILEYEPFFLYFFLTQLAANPTKIIAVQ